MTNLIINKLYKSYHTIDYKKYDFYKDDYYENHITEEDIELVKKGIYNNYDEMPFSTVKKILDTIDTYKDDIFYDLGSGMGKLAIQTLFYTNCKKIVGVEYFEELHNIAICVKKNIDINKNLRLHFMKENIMNIDISEATIIYFGVMNHEKAKSDENDILSDSICKKINESKNIRIVISLCKLDIKYKNLIEKQCVPSILPHIVKGYPYPHFFYFIK